MTPTAIRQKTIELLRTIEGYSDKVFDSRTEPIDPKTLPTINVHTGTAKAKPGTITGGLWHRLQTVVILAEFGAKADSTLAALADAIEASAWSVLMGSREWVGQFHHLLTWDSESGRDAETSDRRGALRITITGTFEMQRPDPDDMTPLREIRAAMAIDGTTDPVAEERIECDGHEDE